MPSPEEASGRAVLAGWAGRGFLRNLTDRRVRNSSPFCSDTLDPLPQTPPSVPGRPLLLTCHPLLRGQGSDPQACIPTRRLAPPFLGGFREAGLCSQPSVHEVTAQHRLGGWRLIINKAGNRHRLTTAWTRLRDQIHSSRRRWLSHPS